MAGGKDALQLKVAKAKTKRGRRELQKREPKLVEDAKRALFLYGNKTSQVVKDVLSDFSRLKKEEAFKLTRKNSEVMPFETGGEQALERHAAKADCSLFVFGSHSKKRPHNVVLGRLFNHRLYDMVEFGVERCTLLSAFGSAAATGCGNKPEMVFVGERFENDTACRLARSLLLDFFRGQQVEQVNLKGLDRVLFAAAPADGVVLLRQYRIGYKKSGTSVPRVVLQEMGPRLDLRLRRFREAPADMAKDAMKQPRLGKRKEKNVSSDLLDGKVGRIYMPKQDMGGLPLRKMKGLKRERRQEAAAAAAAKKAKPAEANGA